MNSRLMAMGMLKAFENYGLKIVKWTEENIVYFDVPQNPNFNQMELEKFKDGEGLIKRIREVFDEMFGKGTVRIKYKIVN